MNMEFDNQSVWDDRWIDRLVDGELTAEERSALLRRLDSTPDGWRRCALAFLEAQAWREALAPSASSSPWLPSLPEVGQNEPRTVKELAIIRRVPRPRPRPWQKLSAIAAALVVAFTIGRLGRDATPRLQSPPKNTSNPPANVAKAPIVAPTVENNHRNTVVDNLEPAYFRVDPQWLAQLPRPLPETVLRQLRSRGYEVEESEAVLSMGLDDGQQVSVPVDELKLRYVGDYSL